MIWQSPTLSSEKRPTSNHNRSGDRMSTIDYVMVRGDEIRNVKDCKVIPGECVATQHRLVVMEMNVEMTRKPRPRIKQKKTKWWNLEKD